MTNILGFLIITVIKNGAQSHILIIKGPEIQETDGTTTGASGYSLYNYTHEYTSLSKPENRNMIMKAPFLLQ